MNTHNTSFVGSVAHGVRRSQEDSKAVAFAPVTLDGCANTGGRHEVPAHSGSVIYPGRRLFEPAPLEGQTDHEHQRIGQRETNKAPAGRVADESPATTYRPRIDLAPLQWVLVLACACWLLVILPWQYAPVVLGWLP